MTQTEAQRTAQFAAALFCIPDNADDARKHDNIDHAYGSKENNSASRKEVKPK